MSKQSPPAPTAGILPTDPMRHAWRLATQAYLETLPRRSLGETRLVIGDTDQA